MSDTKPQPLHITVTSENDAKEKIAKICINPAIDSAVILSNTNKAYKPDIHALIDAVEAESAKIGKGDMASIEKMLISQAHTLQSIFTNIMGKALNSEYISSLQVYSKIALKAQNQCRQTLATLAEIKNPHRTTFIKNQATNQQVNFNQSQTSSEKNQNKANELLKGNNYATMDITGTTTPSRVDKEMATLEA